MICTVANKTNITLTDIEHTDTTDNTTQHTELLKSTKKVGCVVRVEWGEWELWGGEWQTQHTFKYCKIREMFIRNR